MMFLINTKAQNFRSEIFYIVSNFVCVEIGFSAYVVVLVSISEMIEVIVNMNYTAIFMLDCAVIEIHKRNSSVDFGVTVVEDEAELGRQ
jgi:hypothetical protein